MEEYNSKGAIAAIITWFVGFIVLTIKYGFIGHMSDAAWLFWFCVIAIVGLAIGAIFEEKSNGTSQER